MGGYVQLTPKNDIYSTFLAQLSIFKVGLNAPFFRFVHVCVSTAAITSATFWTHIPLSHWRPSATPFFGVSTEILGNFIPCFLMFELFQAYGQSNDKTNR